MNTSFTEPFYSEAIQVGTQPRFLRLPQLKVGRGATPAALYSLRFPITKRLFDAILAATLLVCLAPLFLLVALLIKLESAGPVFYYSYRVGTNYRIFKFWKFRSMRPDADQLLSSLKGLNQYQADPDQEPSYVATVLCATCQAGPGTCQQQLVDSQGQLICESQHKQLQRTRAGAAFVKIVNDPRVTRIGKFIRNTSIDELPQLYNILKGDMSMVGNRPLPLYEAELLTTDQFAARFIAPAGLTGLWQVSKRGKGGNMSEEERKLLDVEYAKNYSLKKDLQIIWKTIPALFQKESV